MSRALLALLTVLLLAPIAAAPAQEQPAQPEPRASLPDIEDEVMCPICGTALNLSESPQAERERVFIRKRIARGWTKEEIKDALVAEYGPEVLATPETSGFDLAAWVVPGLAIVAGAAALSVGIRRWRAVGNPADAPAADAGADPEANARLEAELDRYGR
ncbi:MAG TPA: cytochrome c-type biogenesis protein CcmH [Solirubrobacterales bacterium]|nr:cytochrome c-type biogenesis protein CcmH [Solirubrobacterales bacterium]